MQTGH